MKRTVSQVLTSALALALFAGVFAGCGKKEPDPKPTPTPPPTPTTVAVTGVSLNSTSLTLVEGSSETLTATVSPGNASNKSVTWTSSATDIATVDGNGKVTAVKTGSATVTVTTADGGKTASCSVTVTPSPFAAERAALEAVYNATGGPSWTNQGGWLSDKPFWQWLGVEVDAEGHVAGIHFGSGNNLSGSLPPQIGDLPYLKKLSIGDYNGHTSLGGTIPEEIGALQNLTELVFLDCDICGTLPQSLDKLNKLENVFFSKCAKLDEQPLPASVGAAKGMQSLRFYLSNFTGPIPESWGNFTELNELMLSDVPINTTLPEFFKNYTKLEHLSIDGCGLHGVLSASLAENPLWWKLWPRVIQSNNFSDEDLIASHLPGPSLKMTARDGSAVDFNTLYAKNKYTVIHNWDINFPDCIESMKKLRRCYLQMPAGEMEIVGVMISNQDEQADVDKAFARADEIVAQYQIPWIQVYDQMYSKDRPFGDLEGYAGYPYASINEMLVFDSNGYLVCTSLTDHNVDKWSEWLVDKYDISLTYYNSTDFSQDGKVETLQTAAEGNGIDIVLMGDGFSDRLIADGTYRKVLEEAMEGFFSEEPMKSFRKLFNVYMVTAVSKNEEFEEGYTQTALGGYFGTATVCGGDFAKVTAYALKAIPEDRLENALPIVILNKEYPCGTCYWMEPEKGAGASFSFFGLGSSEFTGYGDASVRELILHEAAGHGLAKLGDEYGGDNSAITDSALDYFHAHEAFGWFKNVDTESDPAKVKWSRFLTDSRYAAEGLGVFEGAYTLNRGMYRPSKDSMMNSTKGMFNAPSREALYVRIHQLAFGSTWQYDYETFVAWDAVNRARFTSSSSVRFSQKSATTIEFTPPVILNKTWRQVIAK